MTERNGKIHISLDEDGLPGQWMEVVNIGTKSPKQFQRIAELAGGNAPDSVRLFIGEVIVGWNITDPLTGQALPAPSSTALDVNDVPMVATRRFTDSVREQLEALLPKASE